MIELVGGDILRQNAEALVNAVNCVGVMGKGLALQFRHAFPANYHAYRAACERHEVQPGKMLVHETGLLTIPGLSSIFPPNVTGKAKAAWRISRRDWQSWCGCSATMKFTLWPFPRWVVGWVGWTGNGYVL